MRLEVGFGRGEEIKYVSHLDLMRAWERALRRAGIPLAFSQGFNPHPKMALAAPLPVGVTSEAELMDLVLERAMSLAEFEDRVPPQLPPGLWLRSVREVPTEWSSLQSRLRGAEYRALVEGEDITDRVRGLVEATSLPRTEQRGSKSRSYDLRPLVESLWVEQTDHPGQTSLGMRLRAGPEGTGRPQEVLAALELEPLALHRTALHFQPP